MFQLAVYGKGGIGKSTISANLSLALAGRGLRVMQVGCDPKHDSTRLLTGGKAQGTVLDILRDSGRQGVTLEDVVVEGSGGVMCVEAGGPEPGIGCAGRGILTTFDALKRMGADSLDTDVRVYDVLGDVVCGGFAVPLREEYAHAVVIVTSGEFMSMYAANNIMKGILNFGRDRPRLLGLVLNRRDVEGESETVARFAEAAGTRVIAEVPRDGRFREAEGSGATVYELFPGSDAARSIDIVADAVIRAIRGEDILTIPRPLDDNQMSDLAAGREIRPAAGVRERIRVCQSCGTEGWSLRQKYSCAACGALMAYARLSDVAVIVHGPASCAYLMDSAYLSTVADQYTSGSHLGPMPDNIYCSRMDDSSAIFGGAPALRDAMESACSDGFREMVVLTTCVSGMIGDDCDAVARDFVRDHPDSAVRTMHQDGVIGGDYFDGMEYAMGDLISVMDRNAPMRAGTVNVVGSTFFDLQTSEASAELDRMLSVFGLSVGCRFLDGGSMSSVRGFCSGSADILLNEAEAPNLRRRISDATGRDAPAVRIPTGIRGYRDWLGTMAGLTGRQAEAGRELERAEGEYLASVERLRPSFEGRRVIIAACIDRDMDWLIDTLGDLGAEVLSIGYLKAGGLGIVTSAHGDILTDSYGKERMMRDWEALHPDLLFYDVDLPDGYPGRSVRVSRIGPGIRPMFGFLEEVATTLGRGCGE